MTKKNKTHISAFLTAIFARVLILALIVGMTACSTTRRIPDDEILYTGVKGVKISGDTIEGGKTERVPSGVQSAIDEAVDVAPNNYLKILKWRYPFPLGLWVYNNWDNPPKGFKHWLYEKFVEEPVLVSDVRPEVRTHMIEEILDNNGYFRGTATYELIQGKNPKKAKIRYKIQTGPAYPVDTITMLPDTSDLNHRINTIAAKDSYFNRKSPRYSTDSLSTARTRIANMLRNQGYYYFKPEYIEYLADSVENPGHIALKMQLSAKVPQTALNRYTTGDVTVYVSRNRGGGTPDTVKLERSTLIRMMPSRLRTAVIDENVTFRPGRTFSVRDMDRTQSYLARLGIFNSIFIEATPDTVKSKDKRMNVNVMCTFDAPLEATIEAHASSKSNSYIGPGVSLGVNNKNIFGGGEQLSVKVNGAYEWQTGRGNKSLFNSYEVGLTASLAFPRLLAPKFIPRSSFNLNWTRFQLDANLLNRPHYFKMARFNVSVNYDWRVKRYVQSTFTPFKLTYTKLMRTTAEFDSIMDANPAVAQSFRSQFIPQMSYTYIYDRKFNSDNSLNWQFSIQEAGNVFWTIYRACGVKGQKNLFGTPFSQFVKGSAQLVWSRRIGRIDSWLVTRVAAGVAHAYGNSAQVPYSEQFYVGGANSVRAFAVRSIGPGHYKAAPGQTNDYFDRTGTFKFEANVEYRFPIAGALRGAVFLDAGNVWLLKSDDMRPGGTLSPKTFFKDLALGTGLGLRFDISMLVIRADLGIGLHAPYDTGKSGYYNLSSFGKSLAFHLAIGYPF